MKKRMSFILAAVLTAVSLTGCGAGSKPAQTTTSTAAAKEEETTEKATETASKETIVLRLAETQTETYPATMGAIEFARLVEERTDGRIKIEVFTGGQLGGDEQAILEQGIQIDEILYSPLIRAKETARHVSEVTGIPMREEMRLKEQNFGKYEGTPRNGEEFQKAKKIFAVIVILMKAANRC